MVKGEARVFREEANVDGQVQERGLSTYNRDRYPWWLALSMKSARFYFIRSNTPTTNFALLSNSIQMLALENRGWLGKLCISTRISSSEILVLLAFVVLAVGKARINLPWRLNRLCKFIYRIGNCDDCGKIQFCGKILYSVKS